MSLLPSRRNDTSRPQTWRHQPHPGSISAAQETNATPADDQAGSAGTEAPELHASRVQIQGRQLAESLREQGLTRARSIIANAEREAQTVIQAAKDAAEAAEKQARARAEAILAGEPLPPEVAPPRIGDDESASSEAPAVAPKVSEFPPDGSTLRYRIVVPMSFAAMLRFKRDVAQFPGVTSVNVAPGAKGEAVLSLEAPDAADVLRRLHEIPGLGESSE